MRASRTKLAGAFLAGFAFAAGGAPAEAGVPAAHAAGMVGPAHGRFEPFRGRFARGDSDQRGRRNNFSNFGFAGYGLGGYGYGYSGEPVAGSGGAAPLFVSIYTAPNFYAPPDPELAYGPPPFLGPKIIEVGRRAPRWVARPIIVYGDAP